MTQEYSKSSYGLLTTAKVNKKNIFGNESSEEDEESKGKINWFKRKLETNAIVKKQTKLKLAEVEKEDPSVFQYDEIYDEMTETKKKDSILYKNRSENKRPKYIQNLLRSASLRSIEQERRQERKVQREREAEGNEFADKESFVTSAYRSKMEELESLEKEERRIEAFEKATDVRKQKDMSGFYRHLYRQTIGTEKGQDQKTDENQKKTDEYREVFKKANRSKQRFRQRNESTSSSSSSSSSSSRSQNESSESELSSDSKPNFNPSKYLSRTKEEKLEDKRREYKLQREKRENRQRKIQLGENSSSDENEDVLKKCSENVKSTPVEQTNENVQEVNRINKDIWIKVTVGKLFEEALQRYYIRKSSRIRFP